MANFKKALLHHKHAGTALKTGNAATAMSHVGHMLSALKANASGTAAPEQAGGESIVQPSQGMDLRGRLRGMRPTGF